MRVNRRPEVKPARGPLRTVGGQATSTFEGAPAHVRDAKSDLFLLAVSNFYGEDSYYEKADVRNDRFRGLVRAVAAEDPAWTRDFIIWLRSKANIRTAAVVAAVEAANMMLAAGQPGSAVGPSRQLLRDFFMVARPDEPAEAFAYWLATYGRKMPAGVRRGFGDAARAKYTEMAFIKWNGGDKAVRMGDVIEMCHPTPKSLWQSALFKYILDCRRDPKTPIPDDLPMLQKRAAIMAMSDEEKRALVMSPEGPDQLLLAGITWEQASSWGAMTAKVWEGLIPIMGYMALLRNLRNFQEAGISAAATKLVQEQLSSQLAVMNSRQLPFRFLSAYQAATGGQWATALETAMQFSTANIPALSGKTLVLVDTSGSMSQVGFSAKGTVTPVMAGALYGVALASKGEQVDLFGFADHAFRHPVRKGAGVLREAERFCGRVGEVGHGTQTAAAVKATFSGHDRVVIVTDEQSFGGYRGNVGAQVPADVSMYAFNIAGYAPAMLDSSSTRHQLGGLTDATFSMIPTIEAGQRATWPWEQQ